MAILRILLTPVSWLYGAGIFLRNLMYDARIMPVYHSPVPVISVGNITAGGTGKTPFVENLVRRYLRKGVRTCVISRGYKRLSRGMQVVSDGTSVSGNAHSAGDEPYQMAKKFSGAIVIVSGKRSIAADFALKKYKPQLFILDDGFQHRSMARDVDIVIIGGTQEPADIPLLPAGLRREYMSSLRRADLIVRSGAGKNDPQAERLYNVEMRYKITKFISSTAGISFSVDQMRGKRCVVFAGIGNPDGFLSTLKEIDIEIAAFHEFPDHYIYKENDLLTIKQSMEMAKGDFVVTTEKDAVRLESIKLPDGLPCERFLTVLIEAVIVRGEERLSGILNEKIDQLIA